MNNKSFNVIIIGGSYAGLSAAMALGRSLRTVLVIDSAQPCNRQTPHSHNFVTHDGRKPSDIAIIAKEQVLAYNTVRFLEDTVAEAHQKRDLFVVSTASGQVFETQKLLFATGVKDIMPDIAGFDACWGISVIHCPYCHGYEVRGEKTGILANGDFAFHYAQMVGNLTKDLTIFTNGKADFSEEQLEKLAQHNISIVENEIERIIHLNGLLQALVFKDGSSSELTALYNRPDFEQHCMIPVSMGCEMIDHGLIKIDSCQRTTIPGVFACGDNSSPMRAVANAVASGNLSGAMINKELIDEEF